jgi:hypothetical protein
MTTENPKGDPAVGLTIDLDAVPSSLPGSRLLVTREDGALAVRSAEYERSRAESVLLRDLVLDAGDGEAWPVGDVEPGTVHCGPAAVTFAGPRALSIGVGAGDGGTWRLRATVPLRAGVEVDDARDADAVTVRTDLAGAGTVRLRGARVVGRDAEGVRVESAGDGAVLLELEPRAAGGRGAPVRPRAAPRAPGGGGRARGPAGRAAQAPMTVHVPSC